MKARGGPLTHFVVDEAHGEFRDAHVPGAESRFSGNGELDILFPAFTAFHGFHVDVDVARSSHDRVPQSSVPAIGWLRLGHRDARFVVARRALLERRRHASATGRASRRTSRAADGSRTARS